MKKEKDLLSRGVVEDFRQVYEDGHFPEEITFEEFLESHAYFVTVKFHLNRMSRRQDPTQLLSEFGKYYFQIVKAAYGNHLDRMIELQPRVWAFVDFEGTRCPGVIDPSKTCYPHLHGLAVIKPGTKDIFGMVRDGTLIAPNVPAIKEMRFDPFRRELGSLNDLATYAMKGCFRVSRASAGAQELWQVFPAVSGRKSRSPLANERRESEAGCPDRSI